jgi:putative heme-binding domain-containing protein
VRIAEALLSNPTGSSDSLRAAIFDRANDPDLGVRYQLALALGDWKDSRAVERLAKLAAGTDVGHAYFRAALLSCGALHPTAIQQLEPKAARPLLAPASEADLQRLRTDPAATAKARASVVENELGHLPAAGSADRGAQVFGRACALCHKQGDLGFDVGPLLQPLRDKPQDYLVKNILDPNAAIEPRFIASILELSDGTAITGLIKAETPTSITVVQPGGTGGTLLRGEIRKVTPAKSSLMPEDFEKTISAAEMADLVAFLRAGAN